MLSVVAVVVVSTAKMADTSHAAMTTIQVHYELMHVNKLVNQSENHAVCTLCILEGCTYS